MDYVYEHINNNQISIVLLKAIEYYLSIFLERNPKPLSELVEENDILIGF